ncbi:MAG: serine/threonine-protein kinase, partial [Acidobacteriota bacterium]
MRALVVLALVSACGSEGQPLRRWQLDVTGLPGARAVELPANLHRALPAHELDYHLSTEASVTPGAPVTLAIDCFHGRLGLEVDGTPVRDRGDVAVGEHRFAFVPERDRVTLVLTAHFDMSTVSGFGTAPALVAGEREGGDAVAAFNRNAAIIEATVIALFGFLFGILYALDRRRRDHAALAVQAFCATVMPLNLLGVLDRVLGPDGASIVINACGNVLVLGLLYFLHLSNDLGPPRRAFLWLGGALIAAHALVLVWMRAALLLFPVQGLFTNAVVVYVIARYIGLARDRARRTDALLLLAGLGLALVGVVLEYVWLTTGRSPFAGVHTVGLGVLPIAAAQAAVLARQHVERQRALEAAADELRHQVAERSRELSEALAKLSNPRVAIEAGRVIDGRYRVVRRIGAGGMGAVYEVERLADGQRLALKTLRGHADADLLARFAREAQIAAQASHPNLVPVLDVGVADGTLFLVMPLVGGGSLADHRDRWGDARWARPLVRQIAAGLAALHERGIVHRDL